MSCSSAWCHTIETKTFSDRTLKASNGKCNSVCLGTELHTQKVSSMPYFSWTVQFVCDLPMKVLFSCHYSFHFLLSALKLWPSPGTGTGQANGVKRAQLPLPHLFNTTHPPFFVSYPVQSHLNMLQYEHLFLPISINSFQKKEEPRSSNISGDHKKKLYITQKHCTRSPPHILELLKKACVIIF